MCLHAVNKDVELGCLSQLLTVGTSLRKKSQHGQDGKVNRKKERTDFVASLSHWQLRNYSIFEPSSYKHLKSVTWNCLSWQTWLLQCFYLNLIIPWRSSHALMLSNLNASTVGGEGSIFNSLYLSQSVSPSSLNLFHYFKYVRNFTIAFSWSSKKMWN